MMQPMHAHPFDRTPLPVHGAEDREDILHDLGCLEAAVREQPVKAHADAKTAAQPPKEAGHTEAAPRESERRK